MSERIRSKIKKTANPEDEKTFVIRPYELDYVRRLEQVKNTQSHYLQQMQSLYLKTIATRLGYHPDANLEFQIDLSSDKRELTIKVTEDEEV